MNDCKKCCYYSKITKRCVKFRCSVSDTAVFGMVCKKYSENKSKEVRCVDCLNLNKYNYCFAKKKCVDKENIKNFKHCISFIKKKKRRT